MPMTDIGARIKARREYLRLTQQEVAAKLGMGRAALSYWETGGTDIPSDKLAQVAAVLGVKVSYLMGERESESFDDEQAAFHFNGLRPAMKAAAAAQLKALHDAQREEEDAIGRVGKKAE